MVYCGKASLGCSSCRKRRIKVCLFHMLFAHPLCAKSTYVPGNTFPYPKTYTTHEARVQVLIDIALPSFAYMAMLSGSSSSFCCGCLYCRKPWDYYLRLISYIYKPSVSLVIHCSLASPGIWPKARIRASSSSPLPARSTIHCTIRKPNPSRVVPLTVNTVRQASARMHAMCPAV